MICRSCGATFIEEYSWQLNCRICWDEHWGGNPSREEVQAALIAMATSEYRLAQDLAGSLGSAIASVVAWPELSFLVIKKRLEAAEWDQTSEQFVPCRNSGGDLWVRRCG